MEIKFSNYQINKEPLNFTIKTTDIIGIMGKDKEQLVDIIRVNKNPKGKITYNNKTLTKEETLLLKKRTSYIRQELMPDTFNKTVYDLMYYEIVKRRLELKNTDKKIRDSLKIVGLTNDYLEKEVRTLSCSEKKLIYIAKALLSNPDIILVEEPFKGLDLKAIKKLMILFQKIKENYQKTIIFISNDSNMLYKYTDYIFVFKNNKIIMEGQTKEQFQNVELLRKNKIQIPDLVEFTHRVKSRKSVNLDYHKDIRDIIKDIYKHV